MSKKYYAAYSSYGINVTYDSGGWAVHVFQTKQERDAWVAQDDATGTPKREAITAKQANKISPVRGYECDDGRMYHENGWVYDGNGEKLYNAFNPYA